ncbi:uncharacterized protein LOC106766200 [Vigna radiata var. radiata]|uniref:Uncharacterized protein LOC106766200 n=1 Tax=Vigna radiata var. radiata TaxID=3916 RepID=A0A1S3UK76_VIGRR|nr:uncharacterized protein LOC106766200 [Vigna radiata var. radiata]
MITISRSSEQPQFMPIQRSVNSEEIFQKVVKSSVFYVDQREEREACEMITKSRKVLEERRVEKESVEKNSEQEEDGEREKNMMNKKNEGDNREEGVEKLREKEYVKSLPYPKTYSRREKEKQFERFMEIFRKLEITIPFSEALQQMPSYAKFLKELLLKKRKKIRGLELKPTRMTLQLADRSLKYPYGVAEDMEENGDAPLILGKPFMKTTKILIDVLNGKLKVKE